MSTSATQGGHKKPRCSEEAFIRRSERCRFAPPDLPSFADLCREAGDTLFNSILNNSHHVLRHLLPPTSQTSQRSRRHYLQLSVGQSSLTDSNTACYTRTHRPTGVTTTSPVYPKISVYCLFTSSLHVYNQL